MSDRRPGITERLFVAGFDAADIEEYLRVHNRSWLTDADAARYEAQRRELAALKRLIGLGEVLKANPGLLNNPIA